MAGREDVTGRARGSETHLSRIPEWFGAFWWLAICVEKWPFGQEAAMTESSVIPWVC